MKNTIQRISLITALLAASASTGLAQSMASAPNAQDICRRDPRTLIDRLPFTISRSGSYYLNRCLTGRSGQHGITVTRGDVSIDLEGYTLNGVPGSLDGIHVPSGSITRVRIQDGTVANWGGTGIFLTLATLGGQLIEGVNVSNNGGRGVYADECAMIVDCVVSDNAGTGVQVGFGGLVDNCTIDGNGQVGLTVAGGTGIVQRCQASDNGLDGIAQGTGSGWIIAGNSSRDNGRHGINVAAGNLVRENSTGRNDSAGIELRSGRNYVTQNLVTLNLGPGIEAITNNVDEVVVRNIVNGNSPNFSAGIGNDFGIFGTAALSSVLWNNISQ